MKRNAAEEAEGGTAPRRLIAADPYVDAVIEGQRTAPIASASGSFRSQNSQGLNPARSAPLPVRASRRRSPTSASHDHRRVVPTDAVMLSQEASSPQQTRRHASSGANWTSSTARNASWTRRLDHVGVRRRYTRLIPSSYLTLLHLPKEKGQLEGEPIQRNGRKYGQEMKLGVRGPA